MALGDPYISETELKDVLGISDDSEDALVRRVVRASTRAIDNKSAFSTFWNTGTPETRRVPVAGKVVPKRGSDPYYKLLLPDGIASASGLLVSGVSAPILMPTDSFIKGQPATAIRLPITWTIADVDITAIWGWPVLPDDIIFAAQLQSQRYYKRRGSPEGIAGSAEWGMVRIPRLDPDVAAILQSGPYMGPGVG